MRFGGRSHVKQCGMIHIPEPNEDAALLNCLPLTQVACGFHYGIFFLLPISRDSRVNFKFKDIRIATCGLIPKLMSIRIQNATAALMTSHFFKFNPANAKRIDMRTDTSAEYRKNAVFATPRECGGCGKFITDRYLLQALDLYWHEDCLKCGCCDCRLSENGSTLYTRANLVLCRRDYLRLFGTTGYCAACGKVIPAFEMVMKAKGNVYHLECFACQNCNHRFCVGDKFYLCDNKILCEYDYEERLLLTSLEFPSKRSSLHSQQGSNQSPLLSPVLSTEGFSK